MLSIVKCAYLLTMWIMPSLRPETTLKTCLTLLYEHKLSHFSSLMSLKTLFFFNYTYNSTFYSYTIQPLIVSLKHLMYKCMVILKKKNSRIWYLCAFLSNCTYVLENCKVLELNWKQLFCLLHADTIDFRSW